jgi:propanol-preferring alcohol dehydrogenase
LSVAGEIDKFIPYFCFDWQDAFQSVDIFSADPHEYMKGADAMKAMVLDEVCDLTREREPLRWTDLADPIPQVGEILIRVIACGVCHTELDEIEGRTPPTRFPMVLGHQVVGRVLACGDGADRFALDDRVGVAWIYWACGRCQHCRAGRENLCSRFVATGRDAPGGYAQLMTVHQDFAHYIPDQYSDAEAAPLLCAGAIGYRSLRLARLQPGQRLGLTGFGASAHLVLKMVRFQMPDCRVYVFARSAHEQAFARSLGAVWAGDTCQESPERLHAIIDTTPAWRPVVEALGNLEAGGRLVINAIRKEALDQGVLQELDYPRHLWMEKEIQSVANVTRRDVTEFLQLAACIPVKPELTTYDLKDANRALLELKQRRIRGAKVLLIDGDEP